MASRRARWTFVALAALLSLPALGPHFVLDDNVLVLLQRDDPGIEGFSSRPLDLFTFTTGSPDDNRRLMDEGALLPWWSDPELRIAFFRPLSSLTHLFDFRLWPDIPQLMQLHSIAWYLVLLGVVALAYRRLVAPAWMAGLSLLLYAVDDTHGATLGWVANRNALLATALALPALSAHHRQRSEGFAAGRYLGPLWLVLGLGAGETALALGAYLLAYALCIDRGPWWQRLGTLLPYLLVAALWWSAYRAAGYGAFGSGAYHDPGREPAAFALSLLTKWPLLLAAEVGLGFPPLADMAAWGPPSALPGLLWLAAVTLAVFAALAWPVLSRDPQARFWALGAALAALPAAAAVPGERLLLFVSVGTAPLIAKMIAWYARAAARAARFARVSGAITLLLLLVHAVFAPLGLALRAGSMQWLGAMAARAEQSLPRGPQVRGQTVVLLDTPFDALAGHLQLMREARRKPRPEHLYWLSSGSSPATVTRVGPRTLRVEPAQGFLYTMTERHYRRALAELGPGSHVALSEMTARVVRSLGDGRPKAVDFAFRRPLERYHFMRWEGDRFAPLRPPPPGERLVLSEIGFYPAVLMSTLGWGVPF